ncbi:hypothetical protein DRP04_01775 [Archaeoglobales archaeon]|nr:MAG: hypothetical protein DRP04_01775 [Archaeoglobales archaeon]
MQAIIDPYIRPVDGGPWAGSRLPAQSVKTLTALQPFPQRGALRLGLGVIIIHNFKNLTEVRKAAFLPSLKRGISCRQCL